MLQWLWGCIPIQMLIKRLDPETAEVKNLIAESDAFYEKLYPPESNHLDSLTTLAEEHVLLLGCYIDDQLVGCAAAKRMNDDGDYAEIKRLFVKPAFRGRGFSRVLMAELENAVRHWGISVLRLETGIRQPEALGLYESLDYQRRDPFGSYLPDPLSVFMEKKINIVEESRQV